MKINDIFFWFIETNLKEILMILEKNRSFGKKNILRDSNVIDAIIFLT